MLTIEMYNFGPFLIKTVSIDFKPDGNVNVNLPNGAGKTTIINAYLFALRGRGLSGFTCRRVDAPTDAPTSVVVKGLLPEGDIMRVQFSDGSTKLTVAGEVLTQNDFEKRFLPRASLLYACANANILCDEALTADQLRGVFSATGFFSEEREQMVRDLKRAREDLRMAESAAFLSATRPIRTAEPLSGAEQTFIKVFEEYSHLQLAPVLEACPTCGTPRDAAEIAADNEKRAIATVFCDKHSAKYLELKERARVVRDEDADEAHFERCLRDTQAARERVLQLKERIAELERNLHDLDVSVAGTLQLPDGVAVVTEQQLKNGSTKSCFTLTYNGVPLKSVNRAKRIGLLVQMLAAARSAAGLQNWPILVDNAEGVTTPFAEAGLALFNAVEPQE